MESNLTPEERQIIAAGKNYQEFVLATDNTRLAAILLIFGAKLRKSCPLEWIDLHRSRESYLKNLEDPSDPEYQPKPKVTFNFDHNGIPAAQIVKAFGDDFEKLNSDFEALIFSLSPDQRDQIRALVSQLITRACHEALLKREELVRLIKRVPRNAKFDQISSGKRLVRLGKNCSPELRSHYLSKLPAD